MKIQTRQTPWVHSQCFFVKLKVYFFSRSILFSQSSDIKQCLSTPSLDPSTSIRLRKTLCGEMWWPDGQMCHSLLQNVLFLRPLALTAVSPAGFSWLMLQPSPRCDGFCPRQAPAPARPGAPNARRGSEGGDAVRRRFGGPWNHGSACLYWSLEGDLSGPAPARPPPLRQYGERCAGCTRPHPRAASKLAQPQTYSGGADEGSHEELGIRCVSWLDSTKGSLWAIGSYKREMLIFWLGWAYFWGTEGKDSYVFSLYPTAKYVLSFE